MMVTFMPSSAVGGFGLTTLIAGRCAHDVRFDGQRRWNRSWDAKCECFLLLALCIPSSTQIEQIQASMLIRVCFLRLDAPQLMAMGIANVLADGMSMGFGGEKYFEKYFLCAFLTGACLSFGAECQACLLE